MEIEKLVVKLEGEGFRLSIAGSFVCVEPKSKLTANHRNVIRANKPALFHYLNRDKSLIAYDINLCGGESLTLLSKGNEADARLSCSAKGWSIKSIVRHHAKSH